MAILELIGINTYYGLSHVLFNVSIDIRQGEIIYYLGRNGAGKTTTIRSIMGLTPPREGDIQFKGVRIAGKAPFEICRLGVGWVPGGRKIFPDLTVIQNLEVVSRPAKTEANAWTAGKVFELFPALSTLANHQGSQLSGGEKQMLAIGRTLMTNPELLVMDEPSEGLSPIILKLLVQRIREINLQGVSILLSEQNVKFALELAHRGYIIDNGKICYKGTVEELRSNDEVMQRYLALSG